MRLTCESYCVLLLVGRVIPHSAHLHMTRQHSTFKIKLRRAPVAANFRADVKAINEASGKQKHSHGATLPMVLLMPTR